MNNKFMSEAIGLAKEAAEVGEIPVGAVVVEQTSGKIIGKGFNLRETKQNPLLHAEIVAIEQASAFLGKWRLEGCDLYVTLEPCPMCCGAVINSRIERVYFGAYDLKGGAAHSVTDIFLMPFNHRPEVYGGIMEDECAALLSDFFKEKR